MKLLRFGAAALAFIALTGSGLSQARPPSQKTGPITIFGSGSNGDITDMSARSRSGALRSLNSRFSDLPASVVDYGGNCQNPPTVASAVTAAVADGAKFVRLPANCTYIAPGGITPAGVTIVGADPQTSIVSVPDRATQNLQLGARGRIRDIGVVSKFCDTVAQPQNTQKVCPAGEVVNSSDAPFIVANWVGQGIVYTSGPTYTGPGGIQSHDVPMIASIVNGDGADAIYVGSNAPGASGVRAVTGANQANGIWIFNGQEDPTFASTRGLHINEFGDGLKDQKSIYIDRVGPATSIYADDTKGTGGGRTNPFLDVALTRQASGNILNIYQAQTPFSGAFLNVNAGNSGGTFTGSFLQFQRSGATVFAVDAGGTIFSAGALIGDSLKSNSGDLFLSQLRTPSASNAACETGKINVDASFIFVCVAPNTWKRAALSTW